jgi:hypothetical protein
MGGTANDNYAPDGATAAMAGQFDATEFFGDARLLGLVSLKDILKAVLISAAPQLIETVGYAINGTLSDIKPVLLGTLHQLAGAIADFESAANGKVTIGNLRWYDLYPDLAGRLKTFDGASDSQLNSLITALRNASRLTDPQLLSATNNLVAGGNALLSSMDNIINNPAPPLVRDEIAEIIQDWNSLRSLGFAEVENSIIDSMRGQLQAPINRELSAFCAELCNNATTEVLTLLLGISPTQCSSVSGDPRTVLLTLGDAFFDETFGTPFVQAITQLNAALSAGEASINTIRATARVGNEQLAVAVFALITSATNSCLAAGELADISQAVGSAQTTCSEVFKVVRDLAVIPFAGADALQSAISDYEKALDSLDNDFALWPTKVRQDIEPLRNTARTTLNEGSEVLYRIGQQRELAKNITNRCDFASLFPIQNVFDLRRDATIRVKDLVQNVGSMIDAIASTTGGNGTATIGPTLSGLCKASGDLIRNVTSISDLTSTSRSPVWRELTTLAGQLPANGAYGANVSSAQREALDRAGAINDLMNSALSELAPNSDSS